MAKINNLSFFILLRIIEALILIYLLYIYSYTIKNWLNLVYTFIPLTGLVLIANFSSYKKFEKYKTPFNAVFFLFLFILVGIEVLFLFLAPLGHMYFVDAKWCVAGVEVIMGICLKFIKKVELYD